MMPKVSDPESAAINEQVTLAAYSASWPQAFELERERLSQRFPQMFSIEHIGSTAVPGMVAKPVIDILAGVSSMAIADELFEPILRVGYTTSRAFNEMLPDRRWFMRAMDGHRTHHLHVVEYGGATWHRRLMFRDRLRADGRLAERYARLKAGLAIRFRNDREAYTSAKSDFIAAALGAL